MAVKEVLAELGLGEGEIKVYLALLKLGSVPVSALKEETNLHRTTIYDFIEKLLNKGLANYVIRNNVKYYKATDPHKLADFLKEKASRLNAVMPELVKMSEFHKEDIKVEVFKGKEGYKAVLGRMIKEGKDMIGMGFEEEMFEKLMPNTMAWYFRQVKEKNLHEYIFVKEGTKFLYPHKTIHYKYLPEEFFNPNPTMTFGDNVVLLLWNPLSTIMIKNKDLADAYRKWFKMLWDQNLMGYKGKDRVKRIFENHFKELKKGDELMVFGSTNQIPKDFQDYFDDYNKRIKEKGIKFRIIFDEGSKKIIESGKKYGIETKTLSWKNVTPVEINIWKNKIALILWSKEPVAFVIEDKNFAEVFKAFFNMQWSIAKKV